VPSVSRGDSPKRSIVRVEVIADPNARYSGAKISERTPVPGNNARLGETRFETWLTQSTAQISAA